MYKECDIDDEDDPCSHKKIHECDETCFDDHTGCFCPAYCVNIFEIKNNGE